MCYIFEQNIQTVKYDTYSIVIVVLSPNVQIFYQQLKSKLVKNVIIIKYNKCTEMKKNENELMEKKQLTKERKKKSQPDTASLQISKEDVQNDYCGKNKGEIKKSKEENKENNIRNKQSEKNILTPIIIEDQSERKQMQPTLDRKSAGANWNTGKQNITENKKKSTDNHTKKVQSITYSNSSSTKKKNKKIEDKYVALDCEFVGVGYKGAQDMLARVSIVNSECKVLLDKFVKPLEKVTDYRTSISGIRPENITNANDFHVVQKEVVDILKGKILIGHGVHKDLSVLLIHHPVKQIRDTARFKPLKKIICNGSTPSLKLLSKILLHEVIQEGEHNSVEDACASMRIYNLLRKDWEIYSKSTKRFS